MSGTPLTMADSLKAVNDTFQFESGASTSAGVLTGTETIAVSRGAGQLLQTTAQALAYLVVSNMAPQRQSIPVLTAGQTAYVTQGYSVGIINVFVAGIRLNPSQYQAIDGINIIITDAVVLANLQPGMTVDIDAVVSIAVASVASAAQVAALDPANQPAIGTLTGTEIVLTRQGAGLFQTSFSKLASWINGLINPANLPAAGALTGTELFSVNQSSALSQLGLSTLATFVLSQQPPGTLLSDTGTANVYKAANPSPLTIGTWLIGTTQQFTVAHTNTGASTYQPDSLTAIPILGEGFLPLVGGELFAGGVAKLMKLTVVGVNSGNPFCVLLDCSGAPKQVAPATASSHSATLGQVQSTVNTTLQNLSTNVGLDTGAVNAYVVAFAPALSNPVPWVPFWFEVKTTNTGASTLNATGTVEPLVGGAHLPLQGGEMLAGGNALVYWNPTLTSYVLLLCSGASEQIAAGTQSNHAATLGQVNSLIESGVASGHVAFFATVSPPTGYLAANGATVSRTTYSTLFNASTIQLTGTVTSGSNVITATNITPASSWVGMPISGPGIPLAATISAVGSTTITLAGGNATATTAGATVAVCPFGVGDGATTFAVPDLRGKFPRGWDNGAGVDTGRVFGTYQADAYASHNHGVTDPTHVHSYTDPGHSHLGGVNDGIAVTPSAGSGYANSTSSAYTGAADVGIAIQYNATGITTQASGSTETRAKNVALLACIKY
jgi:microcystin-dependent protein